ncbi:MAG: hypothetical protein JRF33_08640 [Deltaproteobacteria bacterium]|nr:hypothetical protein [Deltaproteobacteria bacterium]
MRLSFRIVVWASLFLGLMKPAYADFDLPLLYPVTKILSVSDAIAPSDLARLKGVKNVLLLVRMERGNMLRESTLKVLNQDFTGVMKRMVLTGPLLSVHVEQLRRLDRFEVVFPLDELDDANLITLSKLGPVRKWLVLSPSFNPESLLRLKTIKHTKFVVRVPKSGLTHEQLRFLECQQSGKVHFVLPWDVTITNLHSLLGCRRLGLQLESKKNRLNGKLLNIIKDLRGVEPVIVLNGRLSLSDIKSLSRLEYFILQVELGKGKDYTPGLVSFLNAIAPP